MLSPAQRSIAADAASPAGTLREERRLHSYAAATLVAVAAITALRLGLLAVVRADLYPDEAQYWFWAQTPALGYYSKPPLVAWIIALTTGAFGNGEWAVRCAAPLLHAAAAAFVYLTAARLYDRRTGFWSALIYLTLPAVWLSAFLMSTVAALLPLWAAALYAFVRAREEGGGWWLAVGSAVGFGLLAKYAMVYWLLSAFGFVVLQRGERRHLSPLLGSSLLALLIYAPNLWWNWRHGFASYLHTGDNAALGHAALHPLNLATFIGSQFAVFGPLLFAAMVFLLARQRLRRNRDMLLAAFALPALAIICLEALLSRAEPNWAAPAYVSATILVVASLLRQGWQRLVACSLALHVAAAAALFGGGEALAALGVAVPGKYDPLHRLRGWRDLGGQVSRILAAHPGFGLIADDREVAAALVYYVRPHPFAAAVWDPKRVVKNQWDLTNDLSKHRGESFVIVARNPPYFMRQSFAALQSLPPIAIPLGPGLERHYSLYLGRDFLGYRR